MHNGVSASDTALDFALLQSSPLRPLARSRVALLWLLGMLVLLVGSVVVLLVYLNRFELDEASRRRASDAQWLEQSVQFHFRRLEDDLLMLARQAMQAADRRIWRPLVGSASEGPAAAGGLEGGLLWREPGVVLAQGWAPAGPSRLSSTLLQRLQADREADPGNRLALDLMQSTTVGLRRAAYAGLMRRADGRWTDVVWLAVPFFDRGQFVGNYLAAVSIERAVATLTPRWFNQDHRVSLLAEDAATPWVGEDSSDARQPSRVALNLPGTDLFLQVTQIRSQPATVPRMFFLVALLFLLGMLVSLYALRRDFVKRQQVQMLLQAQVALRSAMESSVRMGLRAWDRQGRILYVNEAFSRMVGYAPAELIGLSMPFPYWPADQHDNLKRVHEAIMTQGTPDEGVEVQFAHRSGQLIDVLINEAPLQTATGEQIGWMSSVLDISERKRAQRLAAAQQERLEASGRLVVVGEVASTLAHELNQPLGALSSFANGLLNRLRDGNIGLAELLPVVERMARLAERAGGIIRRVNDFARRRELACQRLELGGLVSRALSALGEDKTPAPQWTPPDQALMIDADGMLLEHLLDNLIRNAQDWAIRGRAVAQVRVVLSVADDEAVLAVGDSGPGVDDSFRESIFNAFVSLKEGGMGMGLAICRSIVEAHHGRIEVGRDPHLGGACFTVFLPLAHAAASR